MKTISLLVAALLLAGCSPLGGIQPDLATAAQNAGASCIRVKSLVMGDAVYVSINDTKNAIKNGSVSVNPDTCAMTIISAPMMPSIVPVTTTTTGTSTTTIVTKPAP